MRQKLASFALFMTASLLTLGLGEVAVRAVVGDSINLFPRYHASVTYGQYELRRFLPEADFWHTSVDGRWNLRMNNKGFRSDTNYDYPKQTTHRALLLGDSHTAGFEVHYEETFAYCLDENLGSTWDIVNAGVSGFGTAEQLAFFENEGFKYAPDVVVLAFFANDFQDNLKAGLFAINDGQLQDVSFEHTPGMNVQNVVNSSTILQWLGQNSYLYSFGFNTAYAIAKNALLSSKEAEASVAYAVAASDVTDYEYALTEALIRRMNDFCVERGIELLIVEVPQVTVTGGIRGSISSELANALDEMKIRHLRAKDTFRQESSSAANLHVAHGHRHLSPLAHQLVADALSEEIGAMFQ